MHRVFNIKHRIVRREEILRAPLATFDTFDLGDEDAKSSFIYSTSAKSHNSPNHSQHLLNFKSLKLIIKDETLKAETIGANNSKKSLSQAGREDKEGKEAEIAKENDVELTQDDDDIGKSNEGKIISKLDECSEIHYSEITPEGKPKVAENTSCLGAALNRQGTIGRVSIPIKKQDSDSSSSSSSCNESSFTFTAVRPSVGQLNYTNADFQGSAERETPTNLIPENIDPSQILSPSKRKAYERRIERLRVTTSPIARPRSHTPISVVTLDEYANISSPELSPATSSLITDKLKITLPCDEFTSKPKTPKSQSAKRKDSDEICFEFTEEILFSRTKSALVVNEDGQIPISPRRVLIPPTLTPSTSPKLSCCPRFPSSEDQSFHPTLLYIQQNESAQSFFGTTIDEPIQEDWACFPDDSFAPQIFSENKFVEKEELKFDDLLLQCDENNASLDCICIKCSVPLSKHKNSFCEHLESYDVGLLSTSEITQKTDLSYLIESSEQTNDISSVKYEATPQIQKPNEKNVDEIHFDELDQFKYQENVTTFQSVVSEDNENSKRRHLLTDFHVTPSNCQKILESLPLDIKSLTCVSADNFKCDSSKDLSSNTAVSLSASPSIDHLSSSCVSPDVNLAASCDQQQKTFLNFQKSLSPSVSNEQADTLAEENGNHQELMLSKHGDNVSVPCQEIQDILPQSTNPFEKFENLLTEYPLGTIPFESIPERPPSTNPFDDFIIAERSPSTHLFDVFCNVLPDRPPSTNPFDFDYDPNCVVEELSETQSKNSEQQGDLVNFLSSS